MPYITSVERIGIEKGIQQGIQQGVELGIQQGVELGMQQGVQQGVMAMLVRQLTRRFGPLSEETMRRIEAAPLEQLEQWAENILDAATLEDVFKNH